MLRYPDLEQQYADAFAEWADSPDRDDWDATAGDGIA
jgi:hypothetical protein